MKTCPRCGKTKPSDEFYKCKRLKDGLSCYCKDCQKAATKASAAKTPEKAKARQARHHAKHTEERNAASREYYEANLEYFVTKQVRWRGNNRDAWNSRAQKSRAKMKAAVFEAYGGWKCVCCGETQPMFLTLDHIDNDGAAHRKLVKWGSSMFASLVRKNFPAGFQVLCRNCNWGKHANGGICPHQSSKVQRLGGHPVAPSGAKREAA